MAEETKQPEPLRIVGLSASNFKRLVAVEVDAGDGPLVTVGGQNEAGKSSVLDAIAVVIGGAALAPKVPVRRGQTSAEVSADLGELKVTRKWKVDAEGKVTSTLEITNADESAAFRSPQAMLDKLLGSSPFYDPLEFTKLRPADRREAVRRVVGLDFSVQDARRRKLLDDKLSLSRKLESAQLAVEGVAPHEGVPEEEIDPADVLKEIEQAEATVAAVVTSKKQVAEAAEQINELSQMIADADRDVEQARRVLKQEEERAASLRARMPGFQETLSKISGTCASTEAAVVDPAPLKQKMQDLRAVNAKVAHNKNLAKALQAADALKLELATVHEAIAILDAEKQKALEAAPFPVAGMSFSDDDVLLDGLPFDQASTARKLRVSAAMALARAGQLRVLLVKAGNDLDKKSLALLAEIAQEHRAQIWVERVAEAPGEVTVFLEDGGVVRA